MIQILPSILTADFLNLKKDIDKMINNGIKYIHVDVMDGNFVPNITFGHKIIEDIKKHSAIKCDAHLMVMNPEKHIDNFIKAGADSITIHIEATDEIEKTLEKIKAAGVKAGLSINPDTSVETLKKYIKNVDMFLVMSVFPGYGGQKFIPEALEKIDILKRWKIENDVDYDIEVDGGIKIDNIDAVINSGANMIVVGSALYEAGELRVLEWKKYIT